jgi:hypothetical protein
MSSLTAWLEDGYCSIIVANHGLTMLIRHVTQICTHRWKGFANRLHLAFARFLSALFFAPLTRMWNPLPLSPSFYPLHRPPPTHSPLSLSHPTASSRCRPTSLAAPLAPASPVLADRRASQQRTYGGTGTTHKQAADLPSRRRIHEHRGVGRSSLACWATKVAGGGRSSCTAADLGQGTAGLDPSPPAPLLWLRARSRGGSPRGRAPGPPGALPHAVAGRPPRRVARWQWRSRCPSLSTVERRRAAPKNYQKTVKGRKTHRFGRWGQNAQLWTARGETEHQIVFERGQKDLVHFSITYTFSCLVNDITCS